MGTRKTTQVEERASDAFAPTTDLSREAHDVATASLIENWIDETERRAWFLAEITGDR